MIEEKWSQKYFCTMAYYKNICKIPSPSGNIKNPKLSEVVDFLKISEDQIIKS